MTSRTPHPSLRDARAGFSLVELIVVVVVGSLLVLTLQQVFVVHQRFYASQRTATTRHETVRLGMAVLSTALREASLARGDVEVVGPGSLRVRMPLGSAHACGIDNNGGRVGFVGVQGRWVEGAADSVLVQQAGLWVAEEIRRVDGPNKRVPCADAGGLVLQFRRRVPDLDLGTGARAFRSQLIEIGTDGTDHWLYRQDGLEREILLGPLDGPTAFSSWYEDPYGVVLPSSTGADRLGIRLVVRAPDPRLGASARTDSLLMTFGGRNR